MTDADQPPDASGGQEVTILGRAYRIGATYRHRPGARGADRRLVAHVPVVGNDDGTPQESLVVYSSGGATGSCPDAELVAWAGAAR